jgi:cell division protein FtsI/penicillin-binding protein 2
MHVAIPAGVADKQKIRVRGKGEASMTGGPVGDLILTVTVTVAPAEDPQIVVTVMVADGGGLGQSGSGNSVAAPIARAIMKAVLSQ